jgi:chloramphenicol 3-O-phosphotransferase
MKQFLVIIRGAPASGKTTIAKSMMDFDEKIVWLKVDNFKDFFSANENMERQKYVDECALASLKYMLDRGFSVVMEKIFFDPFIIPMAVRAAEEKNMIVKVFQIKCPLVVLQERDRNRPGIKEGCRKPLGDKKIEELFNQLEKTYYPGAILLDTAKHSIDECVSSIKQELKN